MEKQSEISSLGSSRHIGSYVEKEDNDMDEINLDVNEAPAIGAPYRGMGKEELLRHSSKPFWRRLRMACISVVIIGWLALLITVVALVLIYPRCREADDRAWWQKEAIYRIYVRSYKDSDGDGIGDLKGIESKLDYIKGLGIKAISLSSIYAADDKDTDFNVINHKDIDSQFGNLDDFKSLLQLCHDKDMYLILDFIPNHTSDQHEWFTNSSVSAGRNNDFRNFYLWSESRTNWRTVYNRDSWTNHPTRNQLYLHQFLESEPDLNLRSSQVQNSLEDIMTFWLDMGVDGFYLRNSAFMFEDYDMRDEDMVDNDNTTDPNAYDSYDHTYTYGLPEVYDIIARWRTLIEDYSNTTKRLLMADVRGNIDTVMSYYGHFERDGVHLSLNQHFFDKHDRCDGLCIKEFVDQWMTNLPQGRWANWMMGDETSGRLGSRFNSSFIRAFTVMSMLLPGTPIIYYGDELMLTNQNNITSEPWSRVQGMRGLMQWENTTNGGFCDDCQNTWINSSKEYENNNVKVQSTSDSSLITLVKNLTTLRQEDSFVYGEYSLAFTNENIFSFVREFDGENGFLIAINFGETEEETHDYAASNDSVEKKATVELTTGSDVGYAIEDSIDTTSIRLAPYQGVIVSWKYVAEEL